MLYKIIDQNKFNMAFEGLHYAENGGDVANALNLMRESLGLEPKVDSVPRMAFEDSEDLYEWESLEDLEDE